VQTLRRRTNLERGRRVGGALAKYEDDIYRNNDVVLDAMLHELETLELQNVTY
jgi:hypothetical protein